jgi:hypothetical protein
MADEPYAAKVSAPYGQLLPRSPRTPAPARRTRRRASVYRVRRRVRRRTVNCRRARRETLAPVRPSAPPVRVGRAVRAAPLDCRRGRARGPRMRSVRAAARPRRGGGGEGRRAIARRPLPPRFDGERPTFVALAANCIDGAPIRAARSRGARRLAPREGRQPARTGAASADCARRPALEPRALSTRRARRGSKSHRAPGSFSRFGGIDSE